MINKNYFCLNEIIIQLNITVFGSGNITDSNPLYGDAVSFGEIAAKNGFNIISGGYGGIMEAASKGAYLSGGKTKGITVRIWSRNPNSYLTEIIQTDSLFERLLKLINFGDIYLFFEGGTGTLLELASIMELISKGSISETKPVIFYRNYWKPVINLIENEPGVRKLISEEKIFYIQRPEELIRITNNICKQL